MAALSLETLNISAADVPDFAVYVQVNDNRGVFIQNTSGHTSVVGLETRSQSVRVAAIYG